MSGYDAGGSFLGLGFSHYGGADQQQSSSPVDAADNLMKHYLQQCLDFHHEQQQQHEQAQQQVNEDAVPQFITAQHEPPAPVEDTVGMHQAAANTFATSMPHGDNTNNDVLADPSTQEAIAKAQAILQKFQQQHHYHHHLQTTEQTSSLLPSDFRHRRLLQLQKEQERLHKATIKNFEYVAKREEERLQRQLLRIQETQVIEQQLQQQQAQLLQQRQVTSQSKAGIGTSRRQALEKKKQRQGHVVRQQSNETTVALYLSGLPITTVSEDMIRQLFTSYGRIQRVHLYRNKTTGHLKGDALIVYSIRNARDGKEILNAACSQCRGYESSIGNVEAPNTIRTNEPWVQMNGAELPCGSVLCVEPADSQYKQRQSQPQERKESDDKGTMGYYGPSSVENKGKKEAVTVVENVAVKSNDDTNDDDLDEFFDSL